MEFLDIRTDYAFKKVFGSERSTDILLSFLNALIEFEDGSTIESLTIVDPYQVPLIKGMKDTFVDVKAILSNGAHVIIEMQVLNVEGFEKRILYNAAKAYSTQLRKAQAYENLEPIIALTITDFVMFEQTEHIITYFKLIEKETLIHYSDDIMLVFAELPKFDKGTEELKTLQDQWLYFLKYAGELNEIPPALREQAIREALTIANTAGMTMSELDMQLKRKDFIYIQKNAALFAQKQGLKQGLEQGLEQGALQKAKEIARRLLEQDMTQDTVATITGLSRTEVERL